MGCYVWVCGNVEAWGDVYGDAIREDKGKDGREGKG